MLDRIFTKDNIMMQLRKQLIAMMTIVLVMGVGFGCGDDEPPPKPQVVSKKINSPAPETPTGESAPAATPAGNATTPKTDAAPAVEQASPAASDQAAGQKTDSVPASPVKADETNKTMAALAQQADKAADMMFRPRLYRLQGQPDPFKTFYKKKEAARVVAGKAKIKKRAPQTPLERMALGQVRLVGIMRLPIGNKAVVEESSGKGYIIKKGTYIGNQGGRVVSILRDRVIIEEQMENALGKVVIQKKQLKLQKPLGD